MIKKIKSILKAFLRRNVKYEQWSTQIHFYNFWKLNRDRVQDTWLADFTMHYGLSETKKVNFFSVFGNKEIVRFISGFNVFFTGENIHTQVVNGHFDEFKKNYYNKFDIALGFDLEESVQYSNYMRFPLWIMYLIPYDASFDDVKRIIDKLNDVKLSGNNRRGKFASNVSRHDNNGIRGKIIDAMTVVGHVECAGDFRHNSNELRTKFEDNKLAYLHEFKFNICPENSDAEGYVTEKIIESIQAGCIPIYWGSGNAPEQDILNPDAIILFDPNNPAAAVSKVQALLDNKQAYLDFIAQKPFKDNAAQLIWRKIELLKNKMTDKQ